MSERLTHTQVDVMRRIANGEAGVGFRHQRTVDSLKRRGLIVRANGVNTRYQWTPEGRDAFSRQVRVRGA